MALADIRPEDRAGRTHPPSRTPRRGRSGPVVRPTTQFVTDNCHTFGPLRRRHALLKNLPCGSPYVDEDANLSRFGLGGHNLHGVRLTGGKQLFVATFCDADLRRSPVAAWTFQLIAPSDEPVGAGVALRRCERVGSPGIDRRDHAVPVLPPLANHRIDGLVAGCGARALGRD